ncbi:hypothetical protein ACSFA8_07600 [Variovorax sp. RT4R15]|uniref:hypothetical protein n=1 Tax=Variovorax sp. RT4R15 TaxID=3443737 RepID=UPI003F477510
MLISSILGLLGIAVGTLMWVMVFLLAKGGGPFGPAGFATWLLYFGPFAFIAPAICRLAIRNEVVSAIWLAAVSPLVSIAFNFMVFKAAIALIPTGINKDVLSWTVVALALVFWAVIGVRVVKSGWARGADNTPKRLPVESRRPDEDLSEVARNLLGDCPNCDQLLRLSATRCWRCDAMLGGGASWQVIARTELN